MTDPRDDLADLVADVAALLADSASRGVVFEGPMQPLAPPAKPEPEHGKAWSSLASNARQRAENTVLRGADGLRATREDLGDCRRCRLCTQRQTLVFGVGAADADLMVIGEAPGRQEDMRGEPFVGPSGQMLDKMLANVIGVPRENTYITNTVKCRPPNDRNPELDEVEACHPYLMRQIQAVQPKVILVLGTVAFQILFRTNAGITRNRGRWRAFEGIPVMPTFHPAYLLRKPENKRLTFEDLKAVRGKYDELGGRR